MSRRTRLATLPLAALLVACGADPEPGRTTGTAAGSGAAFTSSPAPEDPYPRPEEPLVAPVRGNHGGTITLAVPGDLGSLHPNRPVGATDQQVRNLVYESLAGYDNEKWESQPRLATSWKTSADGLTWTFELRKGVEWADGAPFGADDVVFTYREVFKDSFIGNVKDLMKDSEGRLPEVEKAGPHTVVFRLREKNILFDSAMSAVRIMPRHKWEQAAKEGRFSEILKVGDPLEEMVGCGPFRIVDYKPDEAITFERNPRYWIFDEDGKRLPYAERVVLRVVPDLNTMYTKFLAGEFDLLEPLRPEDYPDARAKEKEGDFKVVPLGPSLRTTYFAVNQNPGQNKETGTPYVAAWKLEYFRMREFRQALSHAVDRDAIVDNLLGGRGSALYAFTPPPNKLWHNPDVPRFPYDKEKAKALLESIGLVDRDGDGIRETPDGHKFSFTLLTNTENSMRVQACTMLQKDLADVGLDVVPSPMVFTTLVRTIQSAYDWDAYLLGWASGVPPDPLMMKNILLSSGQSHNWYPLEPSPATPWEAEIDRLTGDLGQKDAYAERKAIYDRIQVILAEQQPMIFLFHDNLYIAARNRFRNLKPTLLRPHTYWNIEEIAVAR